MSAPVPGEIWADAEGTLMCAATGGGWWVFGVENPIPPDAPKIVHPLRLMFTNEGEHVGGSLYPEVIRLMRALEQSIREAKAAVPDVIECWVCSEPTVGDSDYCRSHKGLNLS